MSEDLIRERSLRLFQFLRELSQLRSKTVRNMDRDHKVLWFDKLPSSEFCYSVFGVPSDERAEVWLEVEHPKLDPPPKLPAELMPWVDDRELWNLDDDTPNVRETIARVKQLDEIDQEFDDLAPESNSRSGDSPGSSETGQLALAFPAVSDSTSAKPQSSEMSGSLSPGLRGSAGRAASGRKSKSTGKFGRRRQSTEIVRFSDEPGLQKLWDEYLERWRPWSEKVRPFAPVLRLYSELFEIHHQLQSLAEDYELLLGVGCLSWRTPSGHDVFRHLLVARASLHFDARHGKFTVSATADGGGFIVEQDMLELTERPQGTSRSAISSLQLSLADDFWNEEKTNSLLEAYVHSICNHGSYSSSLKIPERVCADATVHLAPAIVLRPRTDQNFVRLFDEMISQVEDGQDVPIGIERLVGIVDDEIAAGSAGGGEDSADDEVYFPLPSNPDQREIAQRLRSRQGILVQGPPGTGKSHTIANLVCHLLAQGKRILVTSHTPRALTVLRDKFPEDMQALCVSAVGDDSAESRKALEDSVAGITAKQNNWNASANREKIAELKQLLHEHRSAEQWTLNSLREIKEKDTRLFDGKFPGYSGTAQQIAQKLKGQAIEHSWFEDVPPADADECPPLTNADMMNLLRLLRLFDGEIESDTRRSTLPSEQLVPPTEFVELANRLKISRSKVEALDSLKEHESFSASAKLPSDKRTELVVALDELIALFYRISKRRESFARDAATEILGDHDRKWRELLSVTREHLGSIESNFRQLVERKIAGLGERDLHAVRADALALRDHLFRGGKLGFGPFRSRVVTNCLYLVQEVRVDGHLCDRVESLENLLEVLELEIKVESLRKHWSGIGDAVPGSLIAAVATFQDYCEPLEDGLELHRGMDAFREALLDYPALLAPDWNDLESIKKFRQVIDSGAAQEELSSCQSKLQQIETAVRAAATSPTAHELIVEMAEALNSLDDERYHRLYEMNLELIQRKTELALRDELLEKLKSKCPKLFKVLVGDCSYTDAEWDKKLERFEQSWNWRRASLWIHELSDPTVFKRLSNDLDFLQTSIRDTIRELAAHKAWAHTFERLTETQRQHLLSWSLAVRRIGKGKGKYAEKHRRDARHHMDRCRSAIPAWIMPIHKVVETVKPGVDAFDVVIVDEASQSGPEALFLMYIGKQLVVVGDDKQISPDFVGLDRASVDALRDAYLKDFPHADAIGLDHSFFDQAKIRYKGKIRLKEHFRCMPEIIQFSNNLCYASQPLIPLRQFGGGRLTPVVRTVYLKNGYQTENTTKPVNIPEAEAILQEISRICKDPAYEGKSIGVISLLNSSGQAKYIEEQLRNSERYVSKVEYEARRIAVGDSYMFQGDERDIILLSMVSAPLESKRVHPLTAEKDERRFNVAVSRARDQLILFHSVQLSDLSPNCVRYKLLSYCQNPGLEASTGGDHDLGELRRLLCEGYAANSIPPKPFDSWFEVDVFLRISDRGYRVLPQVEMNGYRIDLIVEGMRGRLAVECDGDAWHGADRYDYDMARQRDLERCGMRFWRVRGSAFYFDPEKSLEELWSTLDRMGIHPSISSEDQYIENEPSLLEGHSEESVETYRLHSSSELLVAERSE